jgi:retron-type reverse transcriptase
VQFDATVPTIADRVAQTVAKMVLEPRPFLIPFRTI